MSDLKYFISQLDPHIVRRIVPVSEIGDIHHIQLVTGETLFTPGILYAGQAELIANLFKVRAPEETVTVFCADDTYRLDAFFNRAKNKQINLISTDLPLTELYNQLDKAWSFARFWHLEIASAFCENMSLENILHKGGSMLGGHIFLFNPAFSVTGSHLDPDLYDPILPRVREEGLLHYKDVQLMHSYTSGGHLASGGVVHFQVPGQENDYYLKAIHTDQALIAYLLFVTGKKHRYTDVPNLMQSFSSVVRKLLMENYSVPKTTESQLLSLLADYERHPNLSPLEIQNRFLMMAEPVKEVMRCVIINFKTGTGQVPYQFMIDRLGQIFPGCNITVWNNEIVILLSYEKYGTHIADLIDLDAFNAELERFQALAIVSASTRRQQRFYTIFTLTDHMLKMLIEMGEAPLHGNVYFYKEHNIYLTISLCTQRFQELLRHDDIIYLTDPAIIALARYDKAHGTDLVDLLYHYLTNSRNVTKTAKDMFMHRNTVINKINKIMEIVGLPLEDGDVQQRLLFSCHLVSYYRRFLHQDLQL